MTDLPTIYPIRVKKQPYESLFGYVYRFFDENCQMVPKPILSVIGTPYQPFGHNAKTKAKQLNGWFFDNFALDMQLQVARWSVERSFAKTFYGYKNACETNPRFCPICLSQTGYWLQAWTLPYFEACPIHRVRLVARCDHCNQPLEWGKMALWRCACGARLQRMRAHRASQRLIACARLLCSAPDFPCPPHYRTSPTFGFAVTSMRNAYATLRLLEDLYCLRHHLCPKVQELDHFSKADIGQAVPMAVMPIGKELLNWPHTYSQLLQRYVDRPPTNNGHAYGLTAIDRLGVLRKIRAYYSVKTEYEIPVIQELSKFVRASPYYGKLSEASGKLAFSVLRARHAQI